VSDRRVEIVQELGEKLLEVAPDFLLGPSSIWGSAVDRLRIKSPQPSTVRRLPADKSRGLERALLPS
jgi:hypothetical protein